MRNENSEASPGDPIDRPPLAQPVERVDAGELDVVARVLAEAYAGDPVMIWALPKASTRLDDAAAFFTFFLRRKGGHTREVFATSDRSAVAVMATVSSGRRDDARHPSSPTGKRSPSTDYFQWIESFRPHVDHRYLEFIGCLPAQRSRGMGSLLLGSLLAMAARDGLPVWCWSSNPRNLTFYRRLGFEIGLELRRDADTPAVTLLWRPLVR
jgi:GNAT superfamily N-acetyltransferase